MFICMEIGWNSWCGINKSSNLVESIYTFIDEAGSLLAKNILLVSTYFKKWISGHGYFLCVCSG